MPSTHSSQESSSSCDLAAKNPRHTATSFKSIVVEGDNVYTIQPTNLKPAGLDNDSWYSSDDDNDDDNQEGQQQEQHQVIEGNQMMNSNDTRNNNTTNVTSANDDTASVTSAATPATTSTTSPASPNTRARVRRVGGLLIVEKDITGISVRNDFERMVASLHVIVGINHSGNLELPAGGLEEGETILSGAAREMTEEFKHSLLLHLPGPQHARRVNEPSLPVAKSGIPSSVEDIAKNGNTIAVAHPDDVYASIPEHQLASIQFKCNYGEGDAKNRGVTLFLCRYLASSVSASPFDLDELQQIFQTTHVPVAESVCWCEFEKLTLIPIFAAATTATQGITSASDIELSPEFVHCCFPFENDGNCADLADKKQDVLDQLLTWFVVADADAAPSSSSSSDEVERQQQQPATMTKTQAKKLKILQRENRRQAMTVPKSFLDDSNVQIANSFLRFSVRPSRRTLQEREMCSLCYTRECQATASDICPLAARQYAYLQLEKALRLKNGAILLKWKIVPPPSASGSTTVIPYSNIFNKLTRFCQGNEWVHQNYRLANDFLSIASTTPGGDDFFEPYVVPKNGDQNTPATALPPVFAEGVPEVSEVLNEETKAHGYYRRVLVTKVFNLTLHNDDDDDEDVAVLPPPPPRSQQRSNNDRFRSAAASSTTNRAPPRFEDAVAAPQQQRSFFGANNFNRRN